MGGEHFGGWELGLMDCEFFPIWHRVGADDVAIDEEQSYR
jgi:hypothetical protein